MGSAAAHPHLPRSLPCMQAAELLVLSRDDAFVTFKVGTAELVCVVLAHPHALVRKLSIRSNFPAPTSPASSCHSGGAIGLLARPPCVPR